MKPRILLVDDEPNVTHWLRVGLRKEPWELLTADSGEEGLEIVKTNDIHVVVSDERMPGMSGSEFLSEVRRLHPSTMRIILTGQASLEATMRAINEGEIYRFLCKPCSTDELGLAIRHALDHRRLLATAARLLKTTKQQSDLLERLETQTPGITQIERDEDGAYVIETEDDALLDGPEGAEELMQRALAEVERAETRLRSGIEDESSGSR